MLPYADEVLQRHVSNRSTIAVDKDARAERYDTLIKFARCKLLLAGEPRKHRTEYSEIAQTAVLDVRIKLSFSRTSVAAHRLEEELVASHMRTVYSIPKSREYLWSGYSPEPILAEAAASQLGSWRKSEPDSPEPALTILGNTLQSGLLDRGQVGELVARLLLTLARDRAIERATEEDVACLYSRPVPVNTFIEELLPADAAQRVLNSVPDNIVAQANGSSTFKEVFEDAVLNFTHFAKWYDDTALTDNTAAGCFVRELGVICRGNALAVDVFLPILLDKSKPIHLELMTGIFIQVKLREQYSTPVRLAIDVSHFEFFDPRRTHHPYIVLVMELGVIHKPPPLARTPVNPVSLTAVAINKARALALKQPGDHSSDPMPPSPAGVSVPSPPERRSERLLSKQPSVHPRYSINVQGCSPASYGVISQVDQPIYERIVGSGGILAEHCRQDAASLGFVRAMKPFMSFGAGSWQWFDVRWLSPASGEQGGITRWVADEGVI